LLRPEKLGMRNVDRKFPTFFTFLDQMFSFTYIAKEAELKVNPNVFHYNRFNPEKWSMTNGGRKSVLAGAAAGGNGGGGVLFRTRSH